MTESITLAHLSDIHFHHEVGAEVWDLDHDLRHELELDLKDVVNEFGSLRGLLVTGDIAFSGSQDEYDAAHGWLAKVTAIAGCDEKDVWMVPGNHDVVRKVISDSLSIQEFHEKLRTCNLDETDRTLYRYLVGDSAGGEAQLAPLSNYVAFATKYECAITPSRPFWDGYVAIGGSGVTVQIRGMTSPLISDSLDNSDGNRLVMGSLQATISRAPAIIVVSLSHHPISWLRDGEVISELLRPRARIQLWGHRHTHDTSFLNGNLHLSAGAVHPERGATTWEPRYNIIQLSVGEDPTVVTARIDSRVWYRKEGRFGPDFERDGARFQEFTLAAEPAAEGAVAETPGLEGFAVTAARREGRRALAYAFSSLPYQRRLKVAIELHLIEDPASAIKDQRLFELVLARAVEKNALARLWAAVQRERGQEPEPNPFQGDLEA